MGLSDALKVKLFSGLERFYVCRPWPLVATEQNHCEGEKLSCLSSIANSTGCFSSTCVSIARYSVSNCGRSQLFSSTLPLQHFVVLTLFLPSEKSNWCKYPSEPTVRNLNWGYLVCALTILSIKVKDRMANQNQIRLLWSLVIVLLQPLAIHAAGGGRGGRTRGVGGECNNCVHNVPCPMF